MDWGGFADIVYAARRLAASFPLPALAYWFGEPFQAGLEHLCHRIGKLGLQKTSMSLSLSQGAVLLGARGDVGKPQPQGSHTTPGPHSFRTTSADSAKALAHGVRHKLRGHLGGSSDHPKREPVA
jgi:hypothetical protein